MRSLLVQSYCNRCVSEEVNLPTVSLLSRACLFKILYLSAKRNVHVLFFYLFFPRRSFPLNDVNAFQEIFLKSVYLSYLTYSLCKKRNTIKPSLRLHCFVLNQKILKNRNVVKTFMHCNFKVKLITHLINLCLDVYNF